MRILRALAAGVVAFVALPNAANAAYVEYGFTLSRDTLRYDTRDGYPSFVNPAQTSGTFAFDTTANQLLSFNYSFGQAFYYDRIALNNYSPSSGVVALFDAAGSCDLQCFIGAVNTGSYSLVYASPVGSFGTLTFGPPLNGSVTGYGSGVTFRGVSESGTLRVTGPVPEPSTWVLMLLGFGGIGFAMRRTRQNAVSSLPQMG